jgi:hypothetical protein
MSRIEAIPVSRFAELLGDRAMRRAALIIALTLMPPVLHAATTGLTSSQGVDAPLALNFSVDAKTIIPGATIASGEYTISIVEHLTDRVILRVTDKDGKVKSMFLGLTTTALPANGHSGPILWTGKGESALRGFMFPSAPPVEFVYPKAQAVAIAKNNSDKVLAIDPASDNLAVIHDKLSTQDMQIVTLWTLQSSRVGPDSQPAIEAARYQVPAAAAPVEVASATPAAPLRSKPTPKVAAATSEQSAPVARQHAIAVLPHTASELPAMLLAAALALLGSAVLKLRRNDPGEV